MVHKETWVKRAMLAGAVVLLLAGTLAAGEQSLFGNPITVVTVGRARVRAEVVSTPEKLYQGLSHRLILPDGEGMLFVMPGKEIQQFCMRGMTMDLDFLWIDDGRVAGIERQVAANFSGVLTSPVPVGYVLEVPAGFAVRQGIKVGDRVRWR